MIQRMNPPGMSTPTGYSHVVSARGGRTIYVAGQVALDTKGQLVGEGDLAAQTRQVFANLDVALKAAGRQLQRRRQDQLLHARCVAGAGDP